LPAGDSFSAGSASSSQLIGTSGLVGSGSVNGAVRLDVQPAVASSGVIFTDSALGCDGAAFATATTAQASGNAALSLSSTAQASGNAAISLALTAQASGNAALAGVAGISTSGPTATFVAGVSFSAGVVPAGLNNANLIEPIRVVPPTVTNSSTIFPSGNDYYSVCTYHAAQNRTVNVFSFRGTRYPAANVCQVVSGSGVWSTPVILESFYSAGSQGIRASYEPTSQRILITYNTTSSALRSIVLSLSGSTITSYSQGVFYASYAYSHIQESNPAGSNIIVAYTDGSNLYARIVTISGNTATFGTAVTVSSTNAPSFIRISALASNKFVIMYSTTVGVIANVCTTSGTTITVNSAYTLSPYPIDADEQFSLAYHTSGDYLLAFTSANTITYLSAFTRGCIYFTVSGTAITVINYTDISYTSLSGPAYLTYSSVLNRILLIDPYYNRIYQFFFYGSIPYVSPPLGYYAYTYYCRQPAYDSTSNCYVTAGTDFSLGTGAITSISGTYSVLPTRNGFNNFIGLVNTAAGVASGTSTTVSLPGEYIKRNASTFQAGTKLYLNSQALSTSDSYGVLPYNLPGWNSDLPWTNVAYSATASGILVLKSI
jgi:hypothetical protein